MPKDDVIQLAFCWMFDDTDLENALNRLKSFGYSGIELWPSALFGHGPKVWAAALEKTGMRCSQLCPYFNYVDGPAAVAESEKTLEEYLLLCNMLGCKRLRVFTGPVSELKATGASKATEDQWSAAIEAMKKACDRASEFGVELCLECHEGMLSESSAGALRLIESVGRPNLTANMQIPLMEEDWSESAKALGPYTTHLHIHNWHGKSMDFGNGLTYLSEGWFEWEPVISYLVNDLGRSVCLSVEHAKHGGKHDGWVTAEKDGAYLNELRNKVLLERNLG